MRRDLIALPDESKTWVYQCAEPVTDDQAEQIRNELYEFTMQWQSHGVELDCYANLFHNQFLVFVADPSNLPSGCSIDASVHFVQQLGTRHGKDFMDRTTFAYMDGDHVKTIHKDDLKEAYGQGIIGDETFMFNNLVSGKDQFLMEWIIPLNQSWHKKFV